MTVSGRFYNVFKVRVDRSSGPKDPEIFAYDADGNLTEDGRWTYSWNAMNRLVAMETRPEVVTAGADKIKLAFDYDSQGRRFEKKVFSWSGSAWVEDEHWYFVYNGWNLVAKLDGNDDLAVTQTYVWGLDLSTSMQGAGGVGGLLLVTDEPSGKNLYPQYDGDGNVVGLVDAASGNRTATYEYDPFGNLLREVGDDAALNPFRFSTKFADESDLLYYGYRYYSVSVGRWLSRDPIGEEGGSNLYQYVLNSPVAYFDVNGNFAFVPIVWELAKGCAEAHMENYVFDWLKEQITFNRLLDFLGSNHGSFNATPTDNGWRWMQTEDLGPVLSVSFNKDSFADVTLSCVTGFAENQLLNAARAAYPEYGDLVLEDVESVGREIRDTFGNSSSSSSVRSVLDVDVEFSYTVFYKCECNATGPRPPWDVDARVNTRASVYINSRLAFHDWDINTLYDSKTIRPGHMSYEKANSGFCDYSSIFP